MKLPEYRMKNLNLANLLTSSRLACIILIACCFLAYTPDRDYYRWIALGLVLVAIATDILDGKVARLLNQVTDLGRILDAVTDALGFTLGFLFLYFLDLGMRFPLWFVVIVVGRELIVYGLFLAVLLAHGRIEKKPGRLARINTLLLAICIVLLLLRFEYSWMLWVITAITTVITGAENVRAGARALLRGSAEPPASRIKV